MCWSLNGVLKNNFLTKTLERQRPFRVVGLVVVGGEEGAQQIRELSGDFENSNLSCSTIGNKRFPVIICEIFIV